MASSNDNQGLQIAVIIFALLTIVMSGATFYVFKLMEDAEIRVVTANKATEAATKAATESYAQIELLRTWCGMVGQAVEPEATKLLEQFDKDMTSYGGKTVGVEQRNYSKLLANNFTTMSTAKEEQTTERADLTKLGIDYGKLVDQIDVKVKTAETEANTAMQQLATRSQTYDEGDKQNAKQRAALNTNINELRDQVATETDKLAKANQKHLQEITQLENQREGLSETITKLTTDVINVPDGSIRWVSAANRSVYIDVGRGDSIRKQTSFGVWAVDENGVARGPKKAAIEVTQVLGEHLAEARITEDDYSNPILIGDKIYTPLWDPGEKAHFAICGQIDINGDNVSDLQMVRNLISTSGGVLDAELQPDGKMQGAMSINTRFLILGVPFSGKNANDAKTSDTGFGKMQKDGKEIGVQVIPVTKFLDQVGWKDPNRVVNFGRDSDPKDFNYNPPQKGQRAAASREESEQFRRRPPPSNPALRSAYQDKTK